MGRYALDRPARHHPETICAVPIQMPSSLIRKADQTGKSQPMNAASARLAVRQQRAASTQEGAAHLRILLAALFCALMIPFCVSAQGAGICRHCCIPPECCTPALCNLGQESRELLQKIHDEVEAAGQLNNWIAFGNAITCMENGGIGCDPEAAVRAMGAVPAILKGQIDTDVITFLARNPHLPSDDRMYWENYEKNLHTPPTTTK